MASLFGQALIEAYHSRLPIRFENLGFLRRTEISGATANRSRFGPDCSESYRPVALSAGTASSRSRIAPSPARNS